MTSLHDGDATAEQQFSRATPHQRQAISSNYSEDIGFLTDYGLAPSHLDYAQHQANIFGISPANALIVSGIISETYYFRCVADKLRLPFYPNIQVAGDPFFETPSPGALEKMKYLLIGDASQGSTNPYGDGDHAQTTNQIVLAPDCRQLTALADLMARAPQLTKRMCITTPSQNRSSLEARCQFSLTHSARNFLSETAQQFSAKRVIGVVQSIALLLILQVFTVAAFFSSTLVAATVHLATNSFYFGCIFLRLYAWVTFRASSRELPPVWASGVDRSRDFDLPVYSILVPIFREENQVVSLITSLNLLDWPRERLEIKLICEEDDHGTLAAVRAALSDQKGLIFRCFLSHTTSRAPSRKRSIMPCLCVVVNSSPYLMLRTGPIRCNLEPDLKLVE